MNVYNKSCNRTDNKFKYNSGLTVIELLVVTVLIGILATVGLSLSFSSKDRIKLRSQTNEIVGKLHLLKQLATTDSRNYRFTCTGQKSFASYFFNSSTSSWDLYEPQKIVVDGIQIDTPLSDFIISPGGFLIDPSTLRFSASQTIRLLSPEMGNIEITINTSGGIKIEENFTY